MIVKYCNKTGRLDFVWPSLYDELDTLTLPFLSASHHRSSWGQRAADLRPQSLAVSSLVPRWDLLEASPPHSRCECGARHHCNHSRYQNSCVLVSKIFSCSSCIKEWSRSFLTNQKLLQNSFRSCSERSAASHVFSTHLFKVRRHLAVTAVVAGFLTSCQLNLSHSLSCKSYNFGGLFFWRKNCSGKKSSQEVLQNQFICNAICWPNCPNFHNFRI